MSDDLIVFLVTIGTYLAVMIPGLWWKLRDRKPKWNK